MSTDLDDPVYVTWDVRLAFGEYLEKYLRTRRIDSNELSRTRVRECLESYQGQRPYRKADLDFFLDANLRRR